MFRREDKLESLRMKAQPVLGLFGDVRGVVVEEEANAGLRWVTLVQFTK